MIEFPLVSYWDAYLFVEKECEYFFYENGYIVSFYKMGEAIENLFSHMDDEQIMEVLR